jgi:hypothetical protein
MPLWLYWWDVISLLQPAFSRWRTFVWFTVCVAGLSVRTDKLGVTSIVRALGLDGKYYAGRICFPRKSTTDHKVAPPFWSF